MTLAAAVRSVSRWYSVPLVLASAIWRLPAIERLEEEVQEASPPEEEETIAGRMPAPTTAREAAREAARPTSAAREL